jgi:sigma-B regulation protein RsbU (phosphoserine phosphatase)
MPPRAAPAETAFQRWTRRLGLYVLAPLLALAALPMAVHILQKPDLGLDVHRLRVEHVRPDGPADRAGVEPGDRVLAIDGQRLGRMEDWHASLAGDYGLQPRQLRLARGAEQRTVTVVPEKTRRPRMVFHLSTWLAGLLFLMIGWWVHSVRHDAVGRNFFGLCLVFAFFLIDIPDLPSPGYQLAKQLLRELLQYLWPVYFLRFFLMFPATSAVAAGRGGRWLFAPAAVLIVLTVGAHLARVPEDSLVAGLLQGAASLYFLAFFVAGLVVFARKVLRRDRVILHTKLRVILLGVVCGVVPFLVASLVGSGVLPAFPSWEYLGFSLLLVPVSFGVAIMRYGALDTAFVVRASLIYGVLTVLILAGYVVGTGVLGYLLRNTYNVSTYPVLVLAIAACSLAVLPLRRRVQGWVDAAFYPSRRATREALTALGRGLAVMVDANEANEMLLARLHDLYRPRRLSLYLRGDGDQDALVEAGRQPDDLDAAPPLPGNDPVVRFLDGLRRPLFTEELEDWDGGADGRGDGETALPAGTELLVPLVTGNRIFGLLAWGPKSGDALYSQEDLANLGNLALQTAPVLQSLRLHQASLRQRQLETELAVARDIQAELLPRSALESRGVRICGRNAPCREVGGDYYDYFHLMPGRSVAFCIADVAGKGIPASLLMTTVRVSFRELARPGVTPEAVITELDRRVGEVLAGGRFICFFYGVLDLETGLLTYCNAGMEPPLLYRPDGKQESLRRGGPVLGIQAGVPYRRGTVRLNAGDLLVGYTDGITEQTSPDGEEFFEVERLQAMVANARDRAPEAICSRIFSQVDDFGGAEASDDRTVIVLKMK